METRASDDVLAFLARGRVPRERAARKLTDVLNRLAVGEPPLDRARSAWIFGSYARGALDIGDIDLIVEVDEPRSPQRQALDGYYRRAHPYAEIVSALGCGGGSYVNVHVEPVFEPKPWPISPWRKARIAGAGQLTDGLAVPELPLMGHIVTGEPFDPQPGLVWVRGDNASDVADRLSAFTPDATARRHERTTTVAVVDDLLQQLGAETGFMLAAQIRADNLSVRPLLIHERPAPRAAAIMLRSHYSEGSVRGRALGSALAVLEQDGLDITDAVSLPAGGTLRQFQDRPGPRAPAPTVSIDFNAFLVYKAAAGDFPDDDERHLQIWPSGPRHGPWLALEVSMSHRERASRLYHTVVHGVGSRAAAMRVALGLPPLPERTA